MCAKLSMPLPLYYHRGIFRVEKLEIPPRVDGICPFPFDQTFSSCRSSHAALLYAPAALECCYQLGTALCLSMRGWKTAL